MKGASIDDESAPLRIFKEMKKRRKEEICNRTFLKAPHDSFKEEESKIYFRSKINEYFIPLFH